MLSSRRPICLPAHVRPILPCPTPCHMYKRRVSTRSTEPGSGRGARGAAPASGGRRLRCGEALEPAGPFFALAEVACAVALIRSRSPQSAYDTSYVINPAFMFAGKAQRGASARAPRCRRPERRDATRERELVMRAAVDPQTSAVQRKECVTLVALLGQEGRYTVESPVGTGVMLRMMGRFTA